MVRRAFAPFLAPPADARRARHVGAGAPMSLRNGIYWEVFVGEERKLGQRNGKRTLKGIAVLPPAQRGGFRVLSVQESNRRHLGVGTLPHDRGTVLWDGLMRCLRSD